MSEDQRRSRTQDATAVAPHRVTVLGSFTLTPGTTAGSTAPGSIALSADARRLVAYLAVHPRAQRRAALAADLWPGLAGGLPRAAIIVAICGGLTAINVVGVKRAVQLIDGLTLLKAAPLIFVALLGLVAAGGSIEAPARVPPFSDLEAAALLILYAFVGFENSVTPAGETANPRRNIPRALIATICATAALYFLVQLSYVAVMEPKAGGDAPMVAFGRALMGPAGALLLTATAVFSLLGNIGGGLTGTSRTSYAMGRDGLLPAWFGRISPRFATPANSVVFMGGLIAVLALSGSFVWLAVVSTLARMFVYSISIASLAKDERPGPAVWAMMAGAIAVCVWAASQSSWESWRMLLILAAAGSLLYAAARISARKGMVSSIQPPPSTRDPS